MDTLLPKLLGGVAAVVIALPAMLANISSACAQQTTGTPGSPNATTGSGKPRSQMQEYAQRP